MDAINERCAHMAGKARFSMRLSHQATQRRCLISRRKPQQALLVVLSAFRANTRQISTSCRQITVKKRLFVTIVCRHCPYGILVFSIWGTIWPEPAAAAAGSQDAKTISRTSFFARASALAFFCPHAAQVAAPDGLVDTRACISTRLLMLRRSLPVHQSRRRARRGTRLRHCRDS